MKRGNAVIVACALLSFLALLPSQAFAVNSAPTVGTINPSSGSGDANTPFTFTATYKDANGWKDIQVARLLVNTTTATANCLHAEYNQNTNKLYMLADDGVTYIGGFAPGSSNVIENSYARLNCANTKASGSDNALTVKWNVTFKPSFTGAKNTFLKVTDDYTAADG